MKLDMKLEDNLVFVAGGLKVEEGLGCVRKASVVAESRAQG